MKTTYEIIAANRRRTVLLLLLFPAMLALISFLASLAFGFMATENIDAVVLNATETFLKILPFVTAGTVLWMIIALAGGRRMILGFAGAKPMEKRDHPELYRTVENIAIQTGIPTPQIYIMEDKGLNAFATGYSPERAAVAVTRGMLQTLDKPELEAVMAHEFGHILHRDIRVMMIAITMVGIIQLAAEVILRSLFYSAQGRRGGNGKQSGGGVALIIGIAIWFIAFIGAIFVQMGISRRREFMADAQSAHLTRHPSSLISALRKIAENPRVASLEGKGSLAAMCIIDPVMGLFATHPSLSERITALQTMGGR